MAAVDVRSVRAAARKPIEAFMECFSFRKSYKRMLKAAFALCLVPLAPGAAG
jgi:hypothetical protein